MKGRIASIGVVAIAVAVAWTLGYRSDAFSKPSGEPGETGAGSPASAATGIAQVAARDRAPRDSARRVARETAYPPTLPPLGVPLLENIEQLDRRARSGDAAAACRLGAELIDCSEIRGSSYQLKQMQEGIARAKPLADPAEQEKLVERQADTLARWTLSIEAREKRCAGVDEKRWLDVYDYQRIAAESGHLPSMRFLLHRPALEFDVFAQIDQYRQFPGDARRILERAVRAGDGQTLAALLRAHRARVAGGRFEMRTHQALFQSPEELEVYFEVGRLAGVTDTPLVPGLKGPDPMPPTLCPGDSRCSGIQKRARSILADFNRNVDEVKQADGLMHQQRESLPGHTCVQILVSR